MVKLTVTDDDGGTVTSEVTLESPRQIKQSAFLKLNAIETDDKTVRKEIDKAIGNLEESLTFKCWEDDFHLDWSYAPKFFSEEKQVIKSLEKILIDKKRHADFQDVQKVEEIIDSLYRSDVFLAKIMVYDARSLVTKDLKATKVWIDEMLDL